MPTNFLDEFDIAFKSVTPRSHSRHRSEVDERICFMVLILADCIALCAAIGFAAVAEWFLLGRPESFVRSLDPTAALGGLACAVGLMAHLAMSGRYVQRVPVWTNLRVLALTSLSTAGALGAGALLTGVLPAMAPFMGVLLFFPVAAGLSGLLAKALLRSWRLWERRLLIVGSDRAAIELRAALRADPSLGYDVADHVLPSRVVGNDGGVSLSALLERHDASRLLFCAEDGGMAVRQLIQAALIEQVPFAVASHFSAVPSFAAAAASIPGHEIVFVAYHSTLSRPVARMAKIAIDVMAAAFLLFLVAPLFVLIALLIRTDGGPVIFRHSRIGAGGKPFACFKFRTMRVDADRVLAAALAQDPALAAEWRETRKLRNDPRVTRFGAILRKTSLDELPQLLNILRLEMSLVGPRPIVAGEASLYGAKIAHYLAARPGLTGLWQVSGRSNTTFETRVKLDSWYVNHWSIWNDLIVLFKTVPAVLFRSGAF